MINGMFQVTSNVQYFVRTPSECYICSPFNTVVDTFWRFADDGSALVTANGKWKVILGRRSQKQITQIVSEHSESRVIANHIFADVTHCKILVETLRLCGHADIKSICKQGSEAFS